MSVPAGGADPFFAAAPSTPLLVPPPLDGRVGDFGGEPEPGVYLFACAGDVKGELRLLLEDRDAPRVFGRGAGNWWPLVGLPRPGETLDRAAAAAGPGGALDVGGGGQVLRWCLYSPFGAAGAEDDQARCARGAARVPLPPERLWFAGYSVGRPPPWLPDADRRDELEAMGRLQHTSDVDVVVKATSVDDGAYRRSKAAVVALARAKAALRGRHAALRDLRRRGPDDDAANAEALANLANAQHAYHAAKSALAASDAIAVYKRGKAERKHRRAIGLLDESKRRAYARLRVVWIGARDPASRFSALPHDLITAILAALL